MSAQKLHILKFGGSSVSKPERIKNSIEIVRKRLSTARVAVVVSALGGVTDELIRIMDAASKGDESWETRFETVRQRHYDTLDQLLQDEDHATMLLSLDELLADLLEVYQQIEETGKVTPKKKDYVVSFGERMSCRIFAGVMTSRGIPAKAFESQNFVRTNNRFGEADVDFDITKQLVEKLLLPIHGVVPVITGFIGSTAGNEITTLGRSGSDYTAGLMGEALNADFVEIWTDVNGVLTADPNITATAVTIPRLHYREIAEMAHFGTKVLHPRTVLPLEEVDIPIGIYNSFEPDHPGTLITKEYSQTSGTLKSVSVKKDIVLIGLKSKGLDRIHNLLTRAMQALLESEIQVLFSSAASAEFGISFAINAPQCDEALECLRAEFVPEFALGLIDEPSINDAVSMVTVIGDRLVHDLGLSGAVLSVLGENRIAPMATAKGVGNRHFSMILKNDQSHTSVRLLNDHFCVHSQRVRIFLAGTGTIGSALLQQLPDAVSEEYDISIIGICTSKRVLWNSAGIEPASAIEDLRRSEQFTDWTEIVQTLINEYPYRTIFIDTTGSGEVARQYSKLLAAGIHIATPSKRANTMEQSYFDELMRYTSGKTTHYLYETTAGAGLPIFQTIKDLIRSGDRIDRITGVLSGTMTFLFESLQQGHGFGAAVRKARELGYAEPDPRDDLSGEDVARKFLGLARTSGLRIERQDLVVEDLTPASLRTVPLDEFFDGLNAFDAHWKKRVAEAAADGNVLRYVGNLEHGKITVGVQAVPANSPLGSLKGTDNQVAIFSKRYRESPLIIQGPGAGREVTAAGLLADIQKIAIRVVR
jgi:bifunctional aspartokinase / homoserine dehydrogenase 1